MIFTDAIMDFKEIIPYSYSWFYHWYYAQITSYMDGGLQKDYYKDVNMLPYGLIV